MKKNSAARTHRASALGPALPAVASHRRPTTATRLNSTRSRRPSARGSVISGAVPPPTASLEGGGAAPCTASVIRGVLEAEQGAGLHEESGVGAIVPTGPQTARGLERLRE